MSWTAFVSSNVYCGPVNEDGETPDEISYFVVCENERGDRYRSHLSFETEDDVTTEGAPTAEMKAQAFLSKVQAALVKGADPKASDKWFRTRPCYGSEAYAAYGQAEEVAYEREVG